MRLAIRTIGFGLILAIWQAVQPGSGSAQQGDSDESSGLALGGAASASLDDRGGVGGPAGEEDTVREQRFRLHNTWHGNTGGVWLPDARSGPAGTLRVQFAVDFFSSSGFLQKETELEPADNNDYAGGAVSLSWTVLDFLEVFAALEARANRNDQNRPELLQSLGDTTLGVKGFHDVIPWLTLGGDIRLALINPVGDVGFAASGTGFGLRGNATADLRSLEEPVPLVARFNLDYFFDNSSSLIEEVEQQRFEALVASVNNPILTPTNTVAHLVTAKERFGVDVNRTDMLTMGLGFEVPLVAATDFYLQPILEWRWGIPANRQGYNCLHDPPVEENEDSCLDKEGPGAFPLTATLGLRVLPPVRGLNFLAAVDIGLTGTSDFVRELAPNRPWALLVAFSYAVDTRSSPSGEASAPRIMEVARKVVPAKGRVQGLIVERGLGTGVAQATISYPGRELNPQQASTEGRFISYELDPGEVQFEVSHPDYEPAVCTAAIPMPSQEDIEAGAAEPSAGLASEDDAFEGDEGSGAEGEESDTSEDSEDGEVDETEPEADAEQAAGTEQDGEVWVTVAAQDLDVEMRCELVAKPKTGWLQGRVSDAQGAAVAGATITLSGPLPRTATSDVSGAYTVDGLPPGVYSTRVEAPGYLINVADVTIVVRQTVSHQVMLVKRPKTPKVRATKRSIVVRGKIHFATGSAEMDDSSQLILAEIADLLLRQPEITFVEIQGHTDNEGASAHNLQLSQDRADAVRNWLLKAGIQPNRLAAKGYGDTRPLVPNLTPSHRARNRRVQFSIQSPPASALPPPPSLPPPPPPPAPAGP